MEDLGSWDLCPTDPKPFLGSLTLREVDWTTAHLEKTLANILQIVPLDFTRTYGNFSRTVPTSGVFLWHCHPRCPVKLKFSS